MGLQKFVAAMGRKYERTCNGVSLILPSNHFDLGLGLNMILSLLLFFQEITRGRITDFLWERRTLGERSISLLRT